MQVVIFDSFGEYYDLICQPVVDYKRECEIFDDLYHRFTEETPQSILDLGCGTGAHAIPLAKRGYDVTGIDNSEVMITISQRKAQQQNVNVNFVVQDMC